MRDEWKPLEDAAFGLAADFSRLQALVSPGAATETRVAVQQGRSVDQDQPLLRVRHIEERVQRVNRLLFVLRIALPRRTRLLGARVRD